MLWHFLIDTSISIFDEKYVPSELSPHVPCKGPYHSLPRNTLITSTSTSTSTQTSLIAGRYSTSYSAYAERSVVCRNDRSEVVHGALGFYPNYEATAKNRQLAELIVALLKQIMIKHI